MRPLHILFFVFLACALAAPCLAQTAQEVKRPIWAHGTDELILQLAAQRQQADPTVAGSRAHVDFNLLAAWGHYATDATEIGAATSIFRRGGDGGAGAGPFLEYNMGTGGSGNWFLGGDLLGLTSQASRDAAVAGRARIGYKHHIGKDAALRASLDFQRAVGIKAGGDPNNIDQVTFLIGFSVAAPQTVPN